MWTLIVLMFVSFSISSSDLVLDMFDEDFPLVDEFELGRYLGYWYQTYASAFVSETIQRRGLCATAQYGYINDSTASVYNHLRVGQPDGPVRDISGNLYMTNETGKLYIYLIGGSPTPGEYWIMQLGPKTFGEEGLYEYSVVSEPARMGMWVLARDVSTFQQLYEEEVLDFLYSNGFNTTDNYPVPMYQGEDCLYAE